MAMGAGEVVDSILVPFEEKMPGMRPLAVHGLALHYHAVLRAVELGHRPSTHGDLPQPRRADARIGRAVCVGASLDDQMALGLAIDADVSAGTSKPLNSRPKIA